VTKESAITRLAKDFARWGAPRVRRVLDMTRKYGVLYTEFYSIDRSCGCPIAYAVGFNPGDRNSVNLSVFYIAANELGVLYRDAAATSAFLCNPSLTPRREVRSKSAVIAACKMALKSLRAVK